MMRSTVDAAPSSCFLLWSPRLITKAAHYSPPQWISHTAPLDEEGQSARNRLLNAITALLARNHEVITTVMTESFEQVLALQQPNNPEQRGEPDSGTEDDSDGPNTASSQRPRRQKLSNVDLRCCG